MHPSDFSSLKTLLPASVKELLRTGLESVVCSPIRNWYRGIGSVLMYHRITEFTDFSLTWDTPDYFIPHLGLSVNIERFEEQMAYISDRCIPTSVHDLNKIIKKNASPGKPYVLVTFDDGYSDNLELALPIVEKYEIPITIFLTTGFISRTSSPWWLLLEEHVKEVKELSFGGEVFQTQTIGDKQQAFYDLERAFRHATSEEQERYLRELEIAPSTSFLEELYLSWEQVGKLSKHPLVTIGAHTERHPGLSQESRETVRLEVMHSNKILQEQLGEPAKYFAYPFGDAQACGVREAEVLKGLKLEASFTTRSGHLFSAHKAHMMKIPRITIDYFDTLPRFRRKLSGVESISADPFTRLVTI